MLNWPQPKNQTKTIKKSRCHDANHEKSEHKMFLDDKNLDLTPCHKNFEVSRRKDK